MLDAEIGEADAAAQTDKIQRAAKKVSDVSIDRENTYSSPGKIGWTLELPGEDGGRHSS